MDDEFNVPVQFKGTKCILLSRVPTRAELETCQNFDMKTFVTSGKYLNYLKITQGTSIRINVILCKSTQSQYPTMFMIRIHIMTLLLTKPYCWKFSPVL